MTISAQAATGVANYLATLKVINLNGNEGAVWADYLNNICPLVNAQDLKEATRMAVVVWAEMRRSYQIDIEHIHKALKKIHSERIRQANIQPPLGLGDTPAVEIRWLSIVREQVAVGIPLREAEKTAWKAIGRTPPPLETAEQRNLILNQIGRAIPEVNHSVPKTLNAETIGQSA